MSIKRLLAVDLGASGGKCFVGTFDGGSFSMKEIHRFEHEGISFFLPGKGGALSERTYWDDTFIYRNIIAGLQTFKREVGPVIDSIGIDTWGADGQFFSAEGDMLGKVYCYRDHRLDKMTEVIKKQVDPKRLYEITGIHSQPFNMSNQLHWFVKNRRELLLPGCFFLPVPSIFYYYLGGFKQVDSSWASVTQLMDARTRKWSEEILKQLEIPPAVMPEIVKPGTVLGEMTAPLAASIGINRPKLVAAAAHDTASAFAAAPVEDTRESLIISSGTWSLVGKLVPAPITSREAMDCNISNEGGIDNVRLLKNCMGTWLVQELRRGWAIADGKDMSWDEITRLTESAPPFAAFVDPDDAGFYNPPNMEAAIAAFCKKTQQAVPKDRRAYLRLVYESLALKYRMVNEQICKVSGTKTAVVNVVGGGSKNWMLSQFTADSLGLPVVAGPDEATAVGNVMVQALGLGIIRSMGEALPVIKAAFPLKTYKPANKDAWDKAYEQFRRIAGGRGGKGTRES